MLKFSFGNYSRREAVGWSDWLGLFRLWIFSRVCDRNFHLLKCTRHKPPLRKSIDRKLIQNRLSGRLKHFGTRNCAVRIQVEHAHASTAKMSCDDFRRDLGTRRVKRTPP